MQVRPFHGRGMGSLPIPAKAARLRVLEVAKVICFLQGHLVRVRIRVRVRVRLGLG